MGEQPIFSCKAHVFHIDPKTKRSWVPASSAAVSVSFFYDSTRSLYRIISVEGTKAVINSTITPNMTFTKTSQKFGQWSDVRANTVYGLGFPAETELNKFIEKFQEVKEATRGTASKATANGSISGPSPPNVPSSNIPPPAPPPSATFQTNTTPQIITNAASPLATRSSSTACPDGADTPIPNDHATNQTPGTKAASAASQAAAALVHHRSQSLSGLQPNTESPKHQVKDKMSTSVTATGAPNLPALAGGSVEAQLKYENDRLKLALAQSSANAKKWEVELSTLKNNNARLTAALQESTANVEEWKRQLQAYKEDNQKLKARALEAEAAKGNMDAAVELRKELQSLRQRLQEADEGNNERIRTLTTENESLRVSVQRAQSQLETALSAQESQRRVLETLHQQFVDRVQDLNMIGTEFATAILT